MPPRAMLPVGIALIDKPVIFIKRSGVLFLPALHRLGPHRVADRLFGDSRQPQIERARLLDEASVDGQIDRFSVRLVHTDEIHSTEPLAKLPMESGG